MDKYILIMFCIGGGLFFLIFGGIGLIKNYKVTHNKAYIIVEGIAGFRYFPGSGSSPCVVFKYNGEEIFRYVDRTDLKRGERIRVYYNPNGKDTILRIVGRIDNFKYIFMMIPALLFFGFALIVAFPELFI